MKTEKNTAYFFSKSGNSLVQGFLVILLIGLSGCLSSSPSFQVGDCVHAADGSTTFKLTEVHGEKELRGQRYEVSRFKNEVESLPSQRLYSKVPCPN